MRVQLAAHWSSLYRDLNEQTFEPSSPRKRNRQNSLNPLEGRQDLYRPVENGKEQVTRI